MPTKKLSPGNRPLISAVVNTRNEAKNLRPCLQSIAGWCDEIVVVDQESSDGTAEIAREFTRHVYTAEVSGYVEGARSYAIARATGEWLLMLDADEVVPRPLGSALEQVARADTYDYVSIRRITFSLGGRVRWSGWTGDRQSRFARRASLRLTDDIHAGIHPSGRELRLPAEDSLSIWHFNYLDIEHWLEKMGRYTSVEARQAALRGDRFRTSRMIGDVIHELWWRFFRAHGYRDGWRGWALAWLMAMYRATTHLKLLELEREAGRDRAQAEYDAVRARILAGDLDDRSAASTPKRRGRGG